MVAQIQDSSFCSVLLNIPPNVTLYFLIPRFLLSGLLLILAVTQTLRESIDMYRATKQWQPNRYLKLLARHGIIYFFTYVGGFLHIRLVSISTLSRSMFAVHKQPAHVASL